jgi:damage-control phosphatase, subfamily I
MSIMRILPDCLTCIIDDILEALKLLKVSREGTDAVMVDVLKYLAEHYSSSEPPSYYITEMHRILKRRLNLETPFSELREICLASCGNVALDCAREAQGLSGKERMRFFVRWAVASNALDFRTAGAGYSIAADTIGRMLKDLFDAGLDIDETEKIFDRITKARRIVYLPDNVGELPFDKLLIAECASYGPVFTVPFRGGPITSDVVLADAETVKLDEVVGDIIVSGPDTLGVSFKEMTEECKTALGNADVIIGKGQANFYVLSEFGMQFPHAALISLFVTKCRPVSRFFGAGDKISVAAVIKEANGKMLYGNGDV